jgi:hypothetical protein
VISSSVNVEFLVREVRTLVKSFGELATEITVAWIKAKGEASNEPTGVPDIDVVKVFYDTIYDTIQESYNKLIRW